jgi:hypothetical protein
MKPKSSRTTIAVLAAAVAVFAAGSARADVSQTPLATACPAGYELLSVASLVASGPYVLPRLIDATGNGDGYVCGLAVPDSVRDAFCRQGDPVACALEQAGLPKYVFKDNDNPANRNTAAGS